MDTSTYLTFIAASMLFILMPGPNVLVVVATSLQAGWRRGLQTVVGTSLAMVIQLTVAALATSGLLVVLNVGLRWLKWAGVIYLAVLGVRALSHAWRPVSQPLPGVVGSMQRGFWISLTNPKTILFFSAFLPQFISPAGDAVSQLVLLSASFWILATLLDSAYVLLADRLRWLGGSGTSQRAVNGITGSVYLSASALLAGTSRGQ